MTVSLPELATRHAADEAALEATLDRLAAGFETLEPEIDSFVAEPGRHERLARDAEALRRRFPDSTQRPPLFGVPVGVKDIFHVDDLPTRAGSAVPAERLAGQEAATVAALKTAGALVAGKTVTTEFAYFGPGPTRNPADPRRTPGGSSSGSAAAVAAGLCPFALGTQTIGSICRPASYCGIVGFKPTYDRSSRGGVIPLAPSVDHVGAFTRDVAGARLAASILVSDWGSLPRRPSAASEPPRVAIPAGPYLERASADGRRRFEQACDRLRGQGYEVRALELLDDFEQIEARHRLLVAVEAAAVHAPWFDEFAHTYHPQTRNLIETGRESDPGVREEGLTSILELRRRLDRTMAGEGVDLLLSPASQDVAPLGLESTGDPVMNLPWSHAGVPSLSLPLVRGPGELPFGLQVVGRWGADEELLDWASGLEEVLKA